MHETFEEFRSAFYELVKEGKEKGWLVGDGHGIWVARSERRLGSRDEDDAL